MKERDASMRNLIPPSVVAAVAAVLGKAYYNHTALDVLFLESGAPGEPPAGNCVEKCRNWLERCNQDDSVDALEVLGRVIQPIMDHDRFWEDEQTRLRRVFARSGLAYQTDGVVTKAGTSPATQTLAGMIQERDLAAVDQEVQRALKAVDVDPAAGLTAACSLLEALFKTLIVGEGLVPPGKQTIMELWKVVRDHLKLDPSSVVSDDQKRIMSGLISVVDGIGALRTHAGSAHGRSPGDRPIEAREARLALNAAHAVAVFILETW